jgi:hypothetical protein
MTNRYASRPAESHHRPSSVISVRRILVAVSGVLVFGLVAVVFVVLKSTRAEIYALVGEGKGRMPKSSDYYPSPKALFAADLAAQEGHETSSRRLDPAFRARYWARFKVLNDPACTSPTTRAAIQLFCAGDIATQYVSNDLTQCKSIGQSALECSVSLPSALLNEQLDLIYDDDYFNIIFDCLAVDANAVNASLVFESDDEEGGCQASRVAQLGVECPLDDSLEEWDFQFDDAYFECLQGAPTQGEGGGAYTCASLETSGQDLMLSADLDRFPECILSLTGGEVPLEWPQRPLEFPPNLTSSDLPPFGTFQANWGTFLNQTECGDSHAAKIRLTCTNGQLHDLITLYDTVDCYMFWDNGTLDFNARECIDGDPDHVMNGLGSVNYVSLLYLDSFSNENSFKICMIFFAPTDMHSR